MGSSLDSPPRTGKSFRFVRACDAKLRVPAQDDVASEAGLRKLGKCSAVGVARRPRVARALCLSVGGLNS